MTLFLICSDERKKGIFHKEWVEGDPWFLVEANSLEEAVIIARKKGFDPYFAVDSKLVTRVDEEEELKDKLDIEKISKPEKILVVEKGTILTCPSCDVEIAEVIKDLYRFDLVTSSCFRGISQVIKAGDLTECSKCGVLYFQNGKFHTKDGWI